MAFEILAIGIADFNSFKAVMTDLLENEADPVVKTSIIQKVVHKIVVKTEEVEVYFYVGEKHYKRELAIAGSRPLPELATSDFSQNSVIAEKRHSSALPVFHGNPKTSEILFLKPNFFYDAGSNSLIIGRETFLSFYHNDFTYLTYDELQIITNDPYNTSARVHK
ncbi:MAG: hypothetical protein WA160_02395 [Pseudobdellovibrio sp.]